MLPTRVRCSIRASLVMGPPFPHDGLGDAALRGHLRAGLVLLSIVSIFHRGSDWHQS